MANLTQLREPPITAVYSQSSPNAPISLGQVALRFVCNGKTCNETANAVIRFTPRRGLEFVCSEVEKPSLFDLHLLFDAASTQKFELADRGVSFDGFCSAIGGDHGGVVFIPHKSGMVVTRPSTSIVSARFHVFNFPDFFGPDDYVLLTGEPPMQGGSRCGRVILNADGCSITLAATRETRKAAKELKQQGGYVLTHVGEITRNDGSAFSSDDLEKLLTCLQYFLSFALGRWAGVALAVGVDSSGDTAFEQWGLPITADGSWNGSTSWFDECHGELLTQTFPGFNALWRTEMWREPLAHALYWYLGACDRRVGIGVDTGLILAQTALEGLAWTYCVQDRKMVSPSAFKPRGLSASDKLRLLLTSLGIPTQIPAELTALHSKAGKKWDDAADAITGIRNSLVHSDASDVLPDSCYYEAWNLSLWLIDLVLLKLCKHNGKYANRLTTRWVGGVTPVPWA